MARATCDGPGLLAAFRAAVANLEAHAEEVNGLNVFPVPDGDTGSNMVATVSAALAEAEDLPAGSTADRVIAAISFGALMGARGNSGVITSQILRGMAEGLAGKHRFSGLDLAHALSEGTKTAYAAVARPVEGTILTVIREAADAARATADDDESIDAVLTAVVAGAAASVARTPSLLPILREAGVVDSGGQGLLRLFEGALDHLRGARGRAPSRPVQPAAAPATRALAELAASADGAEAWGYETMYLLRARPGQAIDVAALRAHLETIGDSVLVAGDPAAVKVHVHNDRPDLAIAHGLGLGTLSRITVENLDHQAAAVHEARTQGFVGNPAIDGPAAAAAGQTAAPPSMAVTPAEVPALAVVAVASGDGLARIFRDEFGVSAVVRGGQAANPSTGELLAAVGEVPGREVLILPNNPNVILAARQVAGMGDRPVHVVPTRNAAEGFAALLTLDPTGDGPTVAAAMASAARSIQSLAVTVAVRDATLGGRKVKRGQTIVLDPDDGLVAAHRETRRAVLTAIAALEPGFELLTVFYGDGVDLAEAEGLAREIGEVATGAEVEVRHGGQPHYQYLISAE